MKANRGARRLAAWGLLVVAAASPALQVRPALAYSGTEHIRHSDQAYQILNLMRRGAAYAVQAQRLDPAGAAAGKYQPLTQCPESVCPARGCPNGACAAGRQWSRFVAQALAAPAKLDLVKTDLADPPPVLARQSCGNELLKLAPGQLAQCRIGELPFAVRTGWGSNANACSIRSGYIVGGADQNPSSDAGHESGPVLPFFQDLQSNLSGAAIGMWSTGPDDAQDDTHLWVRPSNLKGVGAVRSKVHEIADVALASGVILAAPVVCFAEWAFGRDCFADVRSVAHVVNGLGDSAVAVWEQSTFGQLNITSLGPAPLPGLWHFGKVDGTGQFNKVAGMKFIEGGPNGEIDELDLAIIALSDILGATVHSGASQGVQHYAQFADGDLRTVGDWLGSTVGHVEFEPVQNLAQWGWTQFRGGKLNAKGLGWVLHAIGDAAQPHHTISAIGWGHAAWERFANLTWEENFHEEDVVAHHPDLQEAVAIAFRWWKFLDDRQALAGSSDLAVRELVVAILTETAHLPVSTVGRAYRRGISTPGTLPDRLVRAKYGSEAAAMKDLMQRTIGASLGFLVKASDFVSTGGPSPCDCGPGASRFAQDDAGKIVTAHDGLCHACGRDAFAAMPSWVDGACVAACPPDKPTAQAGICVATAACPAAAPFVDNGACVAACPGTKVVVNHRTCEGTCPAPQRPDAAGFCARLPTPPTPMCRDTSDDGSMACCSPVGAAVQQSRQCCSLDRSPDGFCRGVAGDQCVVDNDCVSLSCVRHRCALGANGGRCLRNEHCASSICVEQGFCVGAAGDSCSSPRQCDSLVCTAGRCG